MYVGICVVIFFTYICMYIVPTNSFGCYPAEEDGHPPMQIKALCCCERRGHESNTPNHDPNIMIVLGWENWANIGEHVYFCSSVQFHP